MTGYKTVRRFKRRQWWEFEAEGGGVRLQTVTQMDTKHWEPQTIRDTADLTLSVETKRHWDVQQQCWTRGGIHTCLHSACNLIWIINTNCASMSRRLASNQTRLSSPEPAIHRKLPIRSRNIFCAKMACWIGTATKVSWSTSIPRLGSTNIHTLWRNV